MIENIRLGFDAERLPLLGEDLQLAAGDPVVECHPGLCAGYYLQLMHPLCCAA